MKTKARESGRPDLADVIGEIYEAALQPQSWLDALTQVNAFLQVRSSALIMADAKSSVDLMVTCGLDLEFLAGYLGHYSSLDPGIPVLNRDGPGAVAFTNQIVPDREFVKSDYADYLGQYNIFYCGGATLARTEGRNALFAIQRPKRAGAYDRHDALRLRQLVPHLQRAFQISRTLTGLAAERNAALEALNRMPYGVILLDERGLAVAVNAAAEAVLARADGLALGSGRLRVAGAAQQRLLEALVRCAAETGLGRGTHSGGALAVTRPSEAAPYRLLVLPVRMPQSALDLGAPRACVACIVAAQEGSQLLQPEHLRQWFGLTPAEARVAAELAKARNPEEIGDRLGIKRETARTHRRAVYDKMDVHGQAELVKLLLQSPAAVFGAPAEEDR